MDWKKDDLPPASSQVDFAGKIEVQAAISKVASVDDYHPQFLPEEKANQFILRLTTLFRSM